MKIMTNQNSKTTRKGLFFSILLLCIFTLSSYRGVACVASFNTNAGVNGHYTFTSTSTGVGSNPIYSWNAGDGSGWHYTGTTFSHIYITNNTFNVILAVYDSSNSCVDTTTVPVTVSNVTFPCTLSASFNSSVGANGVVTFTSTSTGTNGNTLYFWDQADSNQRVQGGSTYVHTYEYQGTYGVWLTIEDTGSAYCIDSVYETVYVGTADSSHCHLNANFTYTFGANGEVTFFNTSTGTSPGDVYYWGSQYYSSHPDSMEITFHNDGTYNITLAIYGDSNCSDSIVIPVTVTNACNLDADFTYSYDSNGAVKFTSTSTGANGSTTYTWNFGDNSGNITGDDTITHQYPFINSYTVTLYDTNSSGCSSYITKTIYIYNRDSLKASFVYQADSMNSLQIDFTSTSQGTNSNTYYRWNPGDGSPLDSGLNMTTYQHVYTHYGPDSANLTIWYTILPKILRHSPNNRYDESSYTLLINVTSGTQTVADNSIYSVYPNPNNGSFNISLDGLAQAKNAEIRISNMMGQVIYQSNATVKGGSTLSNISLSDAASGVYLLQVITSDNTYTSRIAIQK
jgi:PKD repeat protein